jgi:hypothetical protein
MSERDSRLSLQWSPPTGPGLSQLAGDTLARETRRWRDPNVSPDPVVLCCALPLRFHEWLTGWSSFVTGPLSRLFPVWRNASPSLET